MAEKTQVSKVNPVIERVVRNVLKVVFKNLFNVKLDLPEEIKELKPPYILLPNHQGFWDPFLAAAYLKYPVYYITSDAVFRGRLFGFLLKFLGAIPKTKSQSDMDALKQIFQMKDSGRSIGIFPEGQRTWNGITLPLIKSTSKLIRMLKLPVVSVVFKGGYFSHPRWGTSTRKGEILVEYKMLFKGDEVSSMKVSDIHSRLTDALNYDEIEYQKHKQIEFKGGKFAENIEELLFICPSCGSYEGFSSKGNDFNCKDCGRAWRIDKYQTISSAEGFPSKFDNVRDWDNWQIQEMHKRIDEGFGQGAEIFEAENLHFHTGFKSEINKMLGRGSLKLTDAALILFAPNGKPLVEIPVPELTGLNVQNRQILDFYYNGTLYTAKDPGRHFNAYKFWKAIDYLQREKYEMNLPE